MAITTNNTIKETSLPGFISKNFADPAYFDKKIGSQQGFEVSQQESEVSISAIFNAIAITLGKERDESTRKYLAFHDNEGSFICAFYVEKDTTTDSWELGAEFDSIEKVPEKDVIRHTDADKFCGNAALPFYHACYMRGIGCCSSEYDNQIILNVLLSLKSYMESAATDDGYELKLNAEIPSVMISPSLRALNKDTLEAAEPTASLIEDLGTIISKVGKTGISISWEPGETLKPYIKDDELINIMVDSMSSLVG